MCCVVTVRTLFYINKLLKLKIEASFWLGILFHENLTLEISFPLVMRLCPWVSSFFKVVRLYVTGGGDINF